VVPCIHNILRDVEERMHHGRDNSLWLIR
jgi:hypothetical protein